MKTYKTLENLALESLGGNMSVFLEKTIYCLQNEIELLEKELKETKEHLEFYEDLVDFIIHQRYIDIDQDLYTDRDVAEYCKVALYYREVPFYLDDNSSYKDDDGECGFGKKECLVKYGVLTILI